MYDFMGQCEYVMVATDNFTIKAENIPCDGAISQVNYNTTNQNIHRMVSQQFCQIFPSQQRFIALLSSLVSRRRDQKTLKQFL